MNSVDRVRDSMVESFKREVRTETNELVGRKDLKDISASQMI
jgi:hypothetical protein